MCPQLGAMITLTMEHLICTKLLLDVCMCMEMSGRKRGVSIITSNDNTPLLNVSFSNTFVMMTIQL